jgi:hypothetical protein
VGGWEGCCCTNLSVLMRLSCEIPLYKQRAMVPKFEELAMKMSNEKDFYSSKSDSLEKSACVIKKYMAPVQCARCVVVSRNCFLCYHLLFKKEDYRVSYTYFDAIDQKRVWRGTPQYHSSKIGQKVFDLDMLRAVFCL